VLDRRYNAPMAAQKDTPDIRSERLNDLMEEFRTQTETTLGEVERIRAKTRKAAQAAKAGLDDARNHERQRRGGH